MTERSLRADARDNRAKILAAARSAFDDLGPQANLREIARRAKVAQGTVHRHFPTKQALFAAIITDRLHELTELARGLRAEHDPGGAFLAFLTATVANARENRSMAAVFEQAGSTEEMREAGRRMDAELTLLLERAQAQGAIRDDVDLADVHAIAAALLAVDAHHADNDTDRARRVTVVLDGLRPPHPPGAGATL